MVPILFSRADFVLEIPFNRMDKLNDEFFGEHFGVTRIDMEQVIFDFQGPTGYNVIKFDSFCRKRKP